MPWRQVRHLLSARHTEQDTVQKASDLIVDTDKQGDASISLGSVLWKHLIWAWESGEASWRRQHLSRAQKDGWRAGRETRVVFTRNSLPPFQDHLWAISKVFRWGSKSNSENSGWSRRQEFILIKAVKGLGQWPRKRGQTLPLEAVDVLMQGSGLYWCNFENPIEKGWMEQREQKGS